MPSSYLNIAIEAALKAGDVIKKGFGTLYEIKEKPGIQNYVTPFDHEAEKVVISTISRQYPGHAFLAEESGYSPNWESKELLWVIDPLDGTANFTHNIPIFSVSIAAVKKGEVICGVIYQPMSEELFAAEKGSGAFLNGHAISVSKTAHFTRGMGATAFPRNVYENPLNCIDSFVRILKQGTLVRNFGSTAINLGYVSAGKLDACWAIALHPWDVAAAKLLVEEAGGRISTYEGGPYQVLSGAPIIASNGLVHEELLRLLNSAL